MFIANTLTQMGIYIHIIFRLMVWYEVSIEICLLSVSLLGIVHSVHLIFIPLANIRCKMAFFKRAWQKVKVLSRPWPSRSTLALIRPLKWGTLRLWTPSGSKNTSRQSWTIEKNACFSTKTDISFGLFNFDGWYFWSHWEFRDVIYLILKVWSVVKWS